MAARLPHSSPLTALRILAALHVWFLHENIDFVADAPAFVNIHLERTAAVSVFFLISGFLMAYGGIEKTWDRETRRKFLRSRVARVVPLYFIGMALFLPIWLVREWGAPAWEIVRAIGANVFLLQSWWPQQPEPWYINRPGWTVGAFLSFYLVLPWILPQLRKLSNRTLLVLGFLAWATSQVLVYLFENHWGIAGNDLEILHKLPLVRFWEFLMGVIAGILTARIGVAWAHGRFLAIATGGSALLLYLFLPEVWSNYIHNGLLAPLLLIMSIAMMAKARPETRWMDWGPLQRLGTASFTFYILHLPVANYLSGILITMGFSIRFTPLFWVLDLLILIPLTLYVHERVEEPLRQWVLRRGQSSTS